MTGEVKRYSYAGAMHMPESPFGEYVTHAAHLAVVEGLRADAERYRWLKRQGIIKAHVMTSLFKGDTRILAEIYGGNTYVIKGSVSALDAAIDEAMRGGDGRG